MKRIITIGLMVVGLSASTHADEYYKNNKSITKLTAMKELIISNNKTEIMKCYKVIMNDKGSIIKQKGKKK